VVSQAPIHSSAVARLRSRRDGVTERRLCFLAIGDNGASTLTFHALPSPSAASKFLTLLVALVALSTANAATLSGSGGGVQYTLDAGYVAGTEEAFSADISIATFSTWADRGNYDNPFKSHIDTVVAANGATWQKFVGLHGSGPGSGGADFIGVYVAAAAVSPDFKNT